MSTDQDWIRIEANFGRITGLLNGSAYFAIKCKNSAGTILQFELYPPLFTYNVEFLQQCEHV